MNLNLSQTQNQQLRSHLLFSLILQLLILTSSTQGRIASNTSYDGVVYTQNAYTKFGGQTGVQIEDKISNLQAYTMSIWFKTSVNPWDIGKNMDVIAFKPGFECSLSQRNKFTCASDASKNAGQYQIDGTVRRKNWYILTIRSNQDGSNIQIYELSMAVFAQDNVRKFFPFGYNSLSFEDVYIGIDPDGKNDGFIGNLRNFKLFSEYYDDSTLMRTQFVYIYPFQKLAMQILLSTPNDLRNDADRAVGQLIGKEKQLTVQTDFLGAIWCWYPQDIYSYYVEFSSLLQMNQYVIPSSQYSTTLNFNTALQVWFKRSNTANINFDNGPDEVLFFHTNTTKVFFQVNDYDNIKINPLNFTDRTASGGVGFNRWYFLQVTTTSTEFGVKLYEADGTSVPITVQAYPKSLKISSRNIQIGQDFNGYIQGLKYYKTSTPPQNGIYAMSQLFDSSADCLMYFQFREIGMNDDQSFTNLATVSKSNSLGSNNFLRYSQQFIREYGSGDLNGTTNHPLTFDGYTCTDSKEKVFMVEKTSYSSVGISLNNSLNTYTIEFWFKPSQSITGDAYLMGLQDKGQKFVYTAIIQQSDRSLNCYPAYQTNPSEKVVFLDYANDLKAWMHISCIVDFPNSVAKGTLFYNNLDFVYFNEISNKLNLPKQEYNLYLNVNPKTLDNGVQSSYYQELRLWSYIRSTRQIQEGRYHQLDPQVEQPYMYTYSKLMAGQVVFNQNEIDYSDYNLQRSVSFNNVRWQQSSDLIVCPLGMYKGDYVKQLCYREGIVLLQAVVIKNTTHYFVTSFFTIFRNNFLRDNANNIYDYTWTIDKLDTRNNTNTQVFPTYFNKQKTSDTMIFSYDEVSDRPGRYDFKLEATDKSRYQNTYTTAVKMRTFKCANIYDRDTMQSLVYKDMDSQRSVENAVFYYDFSECDDFRFDQDSMEFKIDINDQFSFQRADHNKTEKSFTIRPQLQSNLPLNDYFYLRIKGTWKNKSNSNDILEYNLIYACRYISKLIPKLNPNYYTVLKGQNLVIDYEAKYFNLKQAVADRNFSVQWECPGELNTYCKGQTNQLRLSYEMFVKGGLDFWTSHTIKLIATTNFIQGDGTKQSIGTVDITWLNVNPDANLFRATEIISKEQRIAFQMDINNLLDNQVIIQWIVQPSVDRNCYLNSDNRQQLVLDQLCLAEGALYTVTGNILYSQRQQIIWTSQSTVKMPISPSKGKVTCQKTSGKAYTDEFKCSATGWSVQNSPARYQFFIQEWNTNQLIPISSLSQTSEISTVLPPTKKMTLKVIDESQGIAYADLTLNVQFSLNQTQLTSTIQSIYSSAQLASQTYSSPTMIYSLLILSQALKSMGSTTTPTQLITNTTNTTTNSTNSTIQVLNQQEMINNVTKMIAGQAQNMQRMGSEINRRSFIQAGISVFQALTSNQKNFNTTNMNLIQESISLMIGPNGKESLDYLVNDWNFQMQFFSISENVLNNLQALLDQGYISTALMDDPPIYNPALSNVTIKLRYNLGIYEQYLSSKIYEGQTYYYNNSAFKIQIQKFSRIGKQQLDQNEKYDDWSYTSYYFPLETALQPTSRQSFAVINFKVSPFIGDYYLNQSSTSKTSIYFSYRDEYGKYLTADSVIDRIQITYKYQFTPFVFLPNVTTCGYIGLQDEHWENKSCNVDPHRAWGSITCHCKHMSYYSIIDDYLIRPQKVPLVYLTFRNWTSFVVFLYVILSFVVGTIYTYNKDNQDFRYLHDQEEQQGNVMQSEDSLTVVSLAFKRKVFFMMFAEKYKFSNLIKIYIMLLHPLFQLKYKLDPETPRFYRFLMLYSRMVLLFGLTFWILRGVDNLDQLTDDPDFGLIVFEVILFIILGSILLVPVPILLLCCCRSRYYLIDPKGQSREPSDNELDDPNGVGGGQSDFRDRVTDVMIDTNIPIKLLFLINAHKVEDIMKHYGGKLRYATGEIAEVGKKLYELDADIHLENEQIKEEIANRKQATKDSGGDLSKGIAGNVRDRKRSDEIEEVSTQQNLKSNRNNGTGFEKVAQLNKSDTSTVTALRSNNQSINQARNSPQQPQHLQNQQESNRPLKNRHEMISYDLSANKTEQNILDPMNVFLDFNEEEENLDDDDFEENKRHSFMHEGGENEMSFGTVGLHQNKEKQDQQQQEDEVASDQDSIDTQLFTDEKKELIEERNRFGRIIGNSLALCFNLAIIISVLAIYIKEGYYDLNNQYVWVIVFFGAQILSIFVTDMIALLIIALCITKCFKKRKTCLAKWMRESLYIYEDYRYVVQFANTKIS